MTLPSGSRLGPYQISAKLGAGGMGEVYRALDTRLDRSVAIKVLPADFAGHAELRARFDREARTISQLNHPNICTLYDIGHENGIDYLVMELLDGETLADRLEKGALTLAEVLRFGPQIADALARAHRQGITHRDLKPANVMLTKSGAKLLDFGLAKALAATQPSAAAEDATQHKPLTEEGTILGTFQYMAPEQLAGEEADARTDIFAFGAVVYEMVTGARAFTGKNRTSLVANILGGTPRPIGELQPMTPTSLEHLVQRCLAKDRDERWQSATDVAEELRWIGASGSQPTVRGMAARSLPGRKSIGIAAALGWAVAVLAITAATMYAHRLRTAQRVMQSDITVQLSSADDAPLAVSPDGRRVAAVVTGENTTQLMVRDLSNGAERRYAGTDGATFPFWAPDGSAIGFFSRAALKTINLETGSVQTLCRARFGRGGTWGVEGVIVFAPDINGPLFRISDNGGTPVAVTKAGHVTDGAGAQQGPVVTHRNPMFLPDGRRFLYNAGDYVTERVQAGSIDGKLQAQVLDYASTTSYVDGWLLTVRDRNLVAQRFDEDALAVRGKPIAIARNVEWISERWQGTFSAAAGTLIYRTAAQPKRQFERLDPLETRPTPVGKIDFYSFPALSPDGTRIVVNRFDPVASASDLWMYDLGTGSGRRLSFTARGTMLDSAVFAVDGQRIALATHGMGNIVSSLSIQPVGGGSREPLLESGWYVRLTDWSRDGSTILVEAQRDVSGEDIEFLSLAGERKPVPVVHSESSERAGRFSPDGTWIAYLSDESGRNEVYVTTNPPTSGKWQISTQGGIAPFWSADGKQLYFLERDRVVAAAVREGATFSADAPRAVESLGDQIVDFAVARNGRIVALRELDAGKAPLTMVANWHELLRAR